MKHLADIAGGTALALALAGAALAQTQQTYRLDPTAPMAFESDGSEISTKACTSILKGRARVTQDRTRLIADRLEITQERIKGDCGDVDRVEGKGNVYYVTPIQSIRANNAVYQPTKETAVFDGSVVAVQGKNVTTTDHFVINTTDGTAQLSGGVKGVLYPKTKPKDGPNDAPAAKAGK